MMDIPRGGTSHTFIEDESGSNNNFVGRGRQVELRPTLLIQGQGSRNVQFRDLNFSVPQAAAPMFRASVNRLIDDHIFLYFFLVPVAKNQRSGGELTGGTRSLVVAKTRAGATGRLRSLVPFRLSGLSAQRGAVIRDSHPVVTAQFQHERLRRPLRWRGGNRLRWLGGAGSLGRLGRQAVIGVAVVLIVVIRVVVIRIEIGRKCRVTPEPMSPRKCGTGAPARGVRNASLGERRRHKYTHAKQEKPYRSKTFIHAAFRFRLISREHPRI